MESNETFQSFDGLALTGTYKKPSGTLKAVALLVHGIMSDRNELGFYSEMANSLAESGIATFRFDYRCHPVGDDHSNEIQFSLGGIVNDIDAAFRHLESLVGDETIPKFIVATSFGGGLSAYWGLRHADLIKLLFLCCPVINYEDDLLRNVGPWRDALAKGDDLYYGEIKIERPLINELPHINGIQALSNPPFKAIIFHGDDDNDVPINSSQSFPKCELVVIKGAGHGFGVPGDEELNFPETKANHRFIYSEIKKAIENCQP